MSELLSKVIGVQVGDLVRLADSPSKLWCAMWVDREFALVKGFVIPLRKHRVTKLWVFVVTDILPGRPNLVKIAAVKDPLVRAALPINSVVRL